MNLFFAGAMHLQIIHDKRVAYKIFLINDLVGQVAITAEEQRKEAQR